MSNARMTLAAALFGVAVLTLAACAGIHQGHLFAVPGPDMVPLETSKGVATARAGIAVVAAAQNEVKEADAFYFAIYNRSGQYVTLDRSGIYLLDHNGKVYKQLSRSQKNFVLGARYRPKPPIGIASDTFRYDRSVAQFGDTHISPLSPGEVFTSKIMPGARATFFAYFRKRSVQSPTVTVILPNIELGASREKLTFVFPFEVQRE